MSTSRPFSRRSFLKATAGCATHMALMATPFPAAARTLWSRRSLRPVVAQESFGRLEEVGGGLFAFISTPLTGDYTTTSNGGIIAGRSGVLVVEAFQTPEGARWIAEKARELTGRWPTHVLITHYHGDHSRGLEGYFTDSPATETGGGGAEGGGTEVLATRTTRDLAAEGLPEDAPEAQVRRWADAVLLDLEESSTLDLGGRQVHLIPRMGHTPSDVTVELPEEELTWCGDLFWNGMFPNYMDAIPSLLSRSVRALQAEKRALYTPGHGPLGTGEELSRYVAVIDGLEETARTAVKEGWTAEEAAAQHRIPESLGEWTLFNPSYFQRAVEAWMKEWTGGRGGRPGCREEPDGGDLRILLKKTNAPVSGRSFAARAMPAVSIAPASRFLPQDPWFHPRCRTRPCHPR
ncbi:MAG: MBL fold metallo-hydrolase [Longimicrobiales bacterium]